MNKEEFLNISNNSKQITKEAVIELESILDEFPYFQTAQVLYLKGLKNQNSFKYNNTLKKVAANSTNRTVLFNYITSNVFDYNLSIETEKELLNNIEIIAPEIIDTEKAIKIKNNQIDPSTDLIIDDSKIKELLKIEKELLKKEKELELGKPLKFEKTDEFSFNQWLDFPPKKEIVRENSKEKLNISYKNEKNIKKSELSKQVDLIEKFILKRPKIKSSKTQEIKDVSGNSVSENTSLMTETLARVYMEQKKYNKAISALRY